MVYLATAEVTNESLYKSCVQPVIDAASRTKCGLTDGLRWSEFQYNDGGGGGGIIASTTIYIYTYRL